MKSTIHGLVDLVRNSTPIPYVSKGGGLTLPWKKPSGTEAQMKAYGSVGTLFNIVSTTSQACSQVAWKLYRKSTTGNPNDRVEVTSHPALDLWNRPNKHMTRQELVETVQQHIDLTGEGWVIVGRNPQVPGIPLELWPARPDRMTVIPSPQEYIVGYVYTAEGGGETPLPVNDVLFMRMPDPMNPYRGLGPVASVMIDLDSSHFAAQWNRNFFLNSAQPGGIIEVEKRLSDDEFNELVARWREQHQGVANAHRVAVIEQGKWVTNNYTVHDMQFVELSGLSKEKIREAFGFPKFAAGEVDDVNKATAWASLAWFARGLTVPRLERWKGMLNNDLLPLFGPIAAKTYEFDFVSPVMEDREANNAERDSQTKALATLKGAGVEITPEVLSYLGLPPTWKMAEPEPPPPAPIQATATVGEPLEVEEGPRNAGDGFHQIVARFRAAQGLLVEPVRNEVDLSEVQRQFELRLKDLLAQWVNITAKQRDQILDQVRLAVTSDDLAALANIHVSTSEAAQALTEAMSDMALEAAQGMAKEAAAQGVRIDPVASDTSLFASIAAATAVLLAQGLTNSAGREALRQWSVSTSGDDVVESVREHLESLSTSFVEQNLGGALTSAQNTGRLNTALSGPTASLYASEKMDGRTCGPCSSVDGKWLGNTDDPQTPARVAEVYPNGGYRFCEGGIRCRGTVVSVYRPQTV